MDPELTQPELPLLPGAVALGAVCAIVAVLLLFPLVDRYIRPRYRLERGGAMLLLLVVSVIVGIAGGTAGFYWLREREEKVVPEEPAEQVRQSGSALAHLGPSGAIRSMRS